MLRSFLLNLKRLTDCWSNIGLIIVITSRTQFDFRVQISVATINRLVSQFRGFQTVRCTTLFFFSHCGTEWVFQIGGVKVFDFVQIKHRKYGPIRYQIPLFLTNNNSVHSYLCIFCYILSYIVRKTTFSSSLMLCYTNKSVLSLFPTEKHTAYFLNGNTKVLYQD